KITRGGAAGEDLSGRDPIAALDLLGRARARDPVRSAGGDQDQLLGRHSAKKWLDRRTLVAPPPGGDEDLMRVHRQRQRGRAAVRQRPSDRAIDSLPSHVPSRSGPREPVAPSHEDAPRAPAPKAQKMNLPVTRDGPTVAPSMHGYGQFCPVAVACEIFAERWTPLILRELFAGSRRFSEIRRGMPLISRALLTQRLRHLEDAGVIESRPAGR